MNLSKTYDRLIFSVFSFLGGDARDWCDLATFDPQNDKVFITKDGGFMTLVRYDGLRTLPVDGVPKIIDILSSRFPAAFSRGHVIDVSFHRDPSKGRRVVERNMEFARKAASSFDIDFNDVLDERESMLSPHVAEESIWIALWTMLPSSPTDNQQRQEAIGEQRKKTPEALRRAAVIWEPNIQQHTAFVDDVIDVLSSLDISLEALTHDVAMRDMRDWLNPDITHPQWVPHKKADRHVGVAPKDELTIDDVLFPEIPEQLIIDDIERVGHSDVRIGSRYHRSFAMRLAPTSVESFTALVNRMGTTPFRMRLRFAGDGLRVLSGVKQRVAQALSWDPSSAVNKQIVNIHDEMTDWVAHQSGYAADLRVNFMTWGDSQSELNSRAAKLSQVTSSWGRGVSRPEISDRVARPARMALRMAPGFSSRPEGWIIPAPIQEALWLAPWGRQASPWTRGALEFRTLDGRFYPTDPISSQQNARVVIGFAPMGMGKSLFSNGRILSMFLKPGLARMPRVLIIDVGFSSQGLLSMLKHSVPPSMRHLFEWKRVRMDAKTFGYNPFDLILGARKPIASDRDFLIRILTILCTPVGHESPPESVPGLITAMVDAAYERWGPSKSPRRYNPGLDYAIDHRIKEMNVEPITWWQVMDLLFEAGDIENATRASRYVVPILPEFAPLATDNSINELYINAHVQETGESTPKYVFRMLTEAAKEFPILSTPTKFDPGLARVIALDLGDVTRPSTNPRDTRQSAIMFMLARHIGARMFTMGPEDIEALSDKGLPPAYQKHWKPLFKELKEDVKEIVYDEFHRTGGHPGVVAQVIADIREGRKNNFGVALFSQRPTDFNDTIFNLASSIYVFGKNSPEDLKLIQDKMKLSNEAIDAMEKNMLKPNSGGAYVFARHITHKGNYDAVLRYTRGPRELWALSTTPSDNSLSRRVYESLGPKEARGRLAKHFPNGSAEYEIDRRIQLIIESGGDSDQALSGVIDALADEVIQDRVKQG